MVIFAVQLPFQLSGHALERAMQRNLTQAELLYVYTHGTRLRNAKAIHVFLGHKDIPPADRRDSRAAQLVGTLLMLDPTGQTVLTVYRNRKRGLKDARRKRKYEIL